MSRNTASQSAEPCARLPGSELQVEYLALGSIRPDPRNARTHPKAQLLQLRRSMEAFGFTNPILIDSENVIIAGHGRLLAAKALDLERAPVIRLSHLNEAERRALRLADNKIALNSGWDNDLLRVELTALSAANSGVALDVLGFSTAEIDIRLADPEHPDDEVVLATKAEPSVKSGDIYVLGDHRIGCGDCRDPVFMRRVMGTGVTADVAFLDVPYNVKIKGHANVDSKHEEFAMASGEMSPEAFAGFLADALGGCAKVSRDGSVHFVCMDWRHGAELERVGANVYGKLLNVCVWNKSNAGMGALYRSKHELVYVFRVGDAANFNAVQLGKHGRNRTNVWDYPSVNTFNGSRREDLRLHPTVKPVALVADAIQDVTKRGQVVLDAFLGSGTTLLAAERTGRRCRGVEIEPAYVEVALQRWADMTGRQPKLEQVSSWGEVCRG